MGSNGKSSHDAHDPNSNQENQAPRTDNTTSNKLRQRSTSNLRAPLSTISTGSKATNELGKPANHRIDDDGREAKVVKRGTPQDNIEKLYKHNANFGASDQNEQYDDIPENMYMPEKEDRAGWIHREKLAKIENEELQAAGINLAKARSKGRDPSSGRSRDNSRDRLRDFSSSKEDRKTKVETPVPETFNEEHEQTQWDLRTPEEIANDPVGQMYTNPLLRKSGSKIPVMTTSATPIPPDRYERETPMPRKRTMSGSISPEETLAVTKTRLITSEAGTPTPTPNSKSGSPNKARSKSVATPKPATTQDGNRKVSAPNKALPASPPRPTTRGNESERPRTATSRTEGDPPWLATMYKPDPMLPPDQQLIPTLAKKRQQEMWEAHGDVPSTYDKKFSPLAVYDANGNVTQIVDQAESVPAEAEQAGSWPLKKIESSKMTPPPNTRPTTSSGTANYSTMPKVQTPPASIVGSPRPGAVGSPHIGAMQSPKLESSPIQSTPRSKGKESCKQQQQHSTDADDEVQQKKGCCCIVM